MGTLRHVLRQMNLNAYTTSHPQYPLNYFPSPVLSGVAVSLLLAFGHTTACRVLPCAALLEREKVMKVIFLEDVAGTADAGEVKEVKNGFARNYLLPKNLAAPATPDHLQRVKGIEKAAQTQRLQFSKEWKSVAEAMNGTAVTVEVRVGPSGRLFGAVTGRHIAEKLTEATGREIDHRQVLLGESIHEPGEYPVAIRLYREVHADVTVNVIPEGLTPEEAAAMAAIAADERAQFEAGEAEDGANADADETMVVADESKSEEEIT
jgi:large subunit ribosomal protein L9